MREPEWIRETTRRVHLIYDETGKTLARVALLVSDDGHWAVEIWQHDRFGTREEYDTEREATAEWRSAAQAVTNFY